MRAGQTIPAGANQAATRQHDIHYNPNFYQVTQGYYKLIQQNGVSDYHQSAFGYGWPDAYPFYHMRTQHHSRGDGANGNTNNRLLTITPGMPGYIGGSTTKQDRRADSVSGQAFIDWLNAIGSPQQTATAYTVTAPTPASGLVNTASGNFTVQPNGPYTGTITIAPSGGGLSTPMVLTWANSSAPQTFTITPTVIGTVTLTLTNSESLTDMGSLTYQCTAAPPPLSNPPWWGAWLSIAARS
jgi:hypothetical protein